MFFRIYVVVFFVSDCFLGYMLLFFFVSDCFLGYMLLFFLFLIVF